MSLNATRMRCATGGRALLVSAVVLVLYPVGVAAAAGGAAFAQATPVRQVLTPVTPNPDGSGSAFGAAVAADGDTMLVGAPESTTDAGPRQGRVEVYEREGADYVPQATLTARAEDDSHGFGAAVAIQGDTAVVGAPSSDNEFGAGAGAVHFYERSGTGWTQTAHFIPLQDNDGATITMGGSVALDGDVALVSAHGLFLVYVFERIDGQWTLTGEIPFVQNFGTMSMPVALELPVAVIGAPGNNAGGNFAGAAGVFERGADGTWDAVGHVTGEPGWQVGASVAVHDGRALVGAPGQPGRVLDLSRDAAGTWAVSRTILPPAGSPEAGAFGVAVTVAGDLAAIADEGFAVHVGRRGDDGAWAPTGSVMPGADEFTFGRVIAVTADTVAVGLFGGSAPHVNLHDLPGGGAGQGTRLGDDDPTATAVAISQRRFASSGQRGTAVPPAFVVVSRDDEFADTLAGSSLTGGSPLLLTASDALTPTTRAEIDRLLAGAGTVYLLGGVNAIGAGVAAELAAAGYEVRRLEGPSRVETAVAVADEAERLFGTPDRAWIVRAGAPPDNPTAAWADSVAIGTYAAETRTPVLLTPTDSAHPAVSAWLQARPGVDPIVIGGEAAVSAATAAALGADRRVAGGNRFASAVAIATELWGQQASGEWLVTSGDRVDGWAFGLAAAGLGADLDAPLLLVETQRLPAETDAALACNAGQRPPVTVIGGEAVVASAVAAALASCPA